MFLEPLWPHWFVFSELGFRVSENGGGGEVVVNSGDSNSMWGIKEIPLFWEIPMYCTNELSKTRYLQRYLPWTFQEQFSTRRAAEALSTCTWEVLAELSVDYEEISDGRLGAWRHVVCVQPSHPTDHAKKALD